jgi:hydrogenase expression/formation protein HypE
MKANNDSWPSCPIPKSEYPYIVLAHGGGGKLMHQLIDNIFKQAFKDVALQGDHDGAVLDLNSSNVAFTTDSYVVNPLFFPGGDIGKLAVYGTVNDLAMCGARPLHISAGFILEEGQEIETLWRIAVSMARAAHETNITIATGDTKVVDKGKGDGIYINTSGIGTIDHNLKISPASVKLGDAIIISGDIGRHGIAVMAKREGLELETGIESDCAPLAKPVEKLITTGIEIHCLRDLTRGGLASALVEIAQSAKVKIAVEEKLIPVRDDIRAACELLGFDPIYIANEGRFVAFVPDNQKDEAIEILRADPVSQDACLIGHVTQNDSGKVTVKTILGVERLIDMITGEQLPRIC